MCTLRLRRKSTRAVQRSIPRKPFAIWNRSSGISNRLRLTLFLASISVFSSGLNAGAILSPAEMSGTTLIDFNGLAGGFCNLCGTPVDAQYSDIGVTFNDPTYPGADTTDFNITPYVPGASGNMLYVYQGGLYSDPIAQPFEILFSVPVTAVGFVFGSSKNAYLELSAYGAGDTLLETEDFTGSPAPVGLAGFAGLSESTDIVELAVSYHDASDPSRTLNFSIDDLLFVDPPASVPEPSTLLLIGAGLLAMAAFEPRTRRR